MEKQILSEFDDFSIESPQHLLRKSKRIVDTSSSLPPKKRMVVHEKKLILLEIANPKKSVRHAQIPKEVAIHASVSSPPEQSSLPTKHTDNRDFNEEKILKKYVSISIQFSLLCTNIFHIKINIFIFFKGGSEVQCS